MFVDEKTWGLKWWSKVFLSLFSHNSCEKIFAPLLPTGLLESFENGGFPVKIGS